MCCAHSKKIVILLQDKNKTQDGCTHICVYSQVLVRIQTPAVAGGIPATSACGDRCSRWSWNAAGVTVSYLYDKMHCSFRSPTSSSPSLTSLKCRDSADLKPDSGNTTLHPIRKININVFSVGWLETSKAYQKTEGEIKICIYQTFKFRAKAYRLVVPLKEAITTANASRHV